ncbi:MAG: anion permease [Pseudomonadota bacterium]|nr:anion permease [Pseudomonadota bacterium]
MSPEALMVPAAMSASCAFMLPVATAPNTIVFSTNRFPLALMAKEGLLLNFVGAMIIASVCVSLFG